MASLKLATTAVLDSVTETAVAAANTVGMLNDGINGCRAYTRNWAEMAQIEVEEAREEYLNAVRLERRASIAKRQLKILDELDANPRLRQLFEKLSGIADTPSA